MMCGGGLVGSCKASRAVVVRLDADTVGSIIHDAPLPVRHSFGNDKKDAGTRYEMEEGFTSDVCQTLVSYFADHFFAVMVVRLRRQYEVRTPASCRQLECNFNVNSANCPKSVHWID